MEHIPVLLHEAIEGLTLAPGMRVVDGTVGIGGHAAEILARIGTGGTLYAFDLDSGAIRQARENLGNPKTIEWHEASFATMGEVLGGRGIAADAVLLDLGWNATQLSAGRGFSFSRDEPLMMTLAVNPLPGALTAEAVVNEWSESDLADIIRVLGEERQAKKIARAIVLKRAAGRITSSLVLGDIIVAAVGMRRGRHPGAKTFQALRMLVNHELTTLETGIASAIKILKPGGRLAVITFHSLEDGLTKRLFKAASAAGQGTVITKRPVAPSRREVMANPRARSAKLRILQRL